MTEGERDNLENVTPEPPPLPAGNGPEAPPPPGAKPAETSPNIVEGAATVKSVKTRWSVYRCVYCKKILAEYHAVTPPVRLDLKPCDCQETKNLMKSIPGSSGRYSLDEEIRP